MERGTGGEVDSWCYACTMPDTPRHLVCTAARPHVAAAFDPRWRTETAVLLARGIVADSAPDRLPVLADALEEGGCDDPQVLRHCRECPRHFPHCWVLADLLDRPTVVEAPRLTDAEVRREVERVTGRPVVSSGDAPWDGRLPMRMLVGRAAPALILAAIIGMSVYVLIAKTLGDPRKPTPYTNTFRTPAATPPR
jgi:hypothetical protein